MDITTTTNDGTVAINGTLTPDEMDQHFKAAARDAAADMDIKGFRPGKAPFETVAKTVGEDKLMNDVAKKALNWALPQVFEKEGLEPIDEPQVQVVDIGREDPFVFKATVPVLPEVALPPLDNLTATRSVPEVSDKEVDQALERLRRSRATTVTVDRPAAEGDRVEADFTIRADDAKVEDGESKNHPLVIGSGMYIPGFEEELIGMSAGDQKEFDLDVPEDYKDDRIAGRRIHADVTLKLVQERELPDIDDDFAASLGNFEDVDALRANVKEGLVQEKEEKEEQRVKMQLVEQVADAVETTVPDVLVERELAGMMQEFEQRIAGMGLDFEEYLKHLDKERDELADEWRDQAEQRVRIGLTLRALAREHNIAPTEDEIEERANQTLKRYGGPEQAAEHIDKDRLIAYTREVLTNEKVLAFLEEKADITEE